MKSSTKWPALHHPSLPASGGNQNLLLLCPMRFAHQFFSVYNDRSFPHPYDAIVPIQRDTEIAPDAPHRRRIKIHPQEPIMRQRRAHAPQDAPIREFRFPQFPGHDLASDNQGIDQ